MPDHPGSGKPSAATAAIEKRLIAIRGGLITDIERLIRHRAGAITPAQIGAVARLLSHGPAIVAPDVPAMRPGERALRRELLTFAAATSGLRGLPLDYAQYLVSDDYQELVAALDRTGRRFASAENLGEIFELTDSELATIQPEFLVASSAQRKRRKRRNAGATPRQAIEGEPWKAAGISRATWFRRQAEQRAAAPQPAASGDDGGQAIDYVLADELAAEWLTATDPPTAAPADPRPKTPAERAYGDGVRAAARWIPGDAQLTCPHSETAPDLRAAWWAGVDDLRGVLNEAEADARQREREDARRQAWQARDEAAAARHAHQLATDADYRARWERLFPPIVRAPAPPPAPPKPSRPPRPPVQPCDPWAWQPPADLAEARLSLRGLRDVLAYVRICGWGPGDARGTQALDTLASGPLSDLNRVRMPPGSGHDFLAWKSRDILENGRGSKDSIDRAAAVAAVGIRLHALHEAGRVNAAASDVLAYLLTGTGGYLEWSATHDTSERLISAADLMRLARQRPDIMDFWEAAKGIRTAEDLTAALGRSDLPPRSQDILAAGDYDVCDTPRKRSKPALW